MFPINIIIAVTNISIGNGGVSTHIVDMCRELLLRKHKVILVSDPEHCDYYNRIEEFNHMEGFKFVPVKLNGFLSSPTSLFKVTNTFIKIARQEKADIAHMHSQSLCIVGALMKAATGTPFLWTNHIDEIWKPKLFKVVLKTFHFPIISVSSDLKRMLIEQYGVKANRITVVNNGIDITKFSPLTVNEKQELIEKYDCNGKYVIGILARMSYGKGHKYLLEAVDKLQTKNKLSNLKVLIAGKIHESEIGYYQSLDLFAKEHSIDTEFIGFQNPRDIFGICNISVLPSIYEGFALTAVESLIMGCPVIRSDTPGWSDMQDITLVFHKKNVEGLKQHLLYSYTHQTEMINMGLKGKSIVEEKFTIGIQVEKTLDVYQKYSKKLFSNN